MKLSEHQLIIVQQRVDACKLVITSLRDDLLDHICCSIEHKIKNGQSFEESLIEAIDELAPDGLQELERETMKLLDSKNIPMKKFMYVLGLICQAELNFPTLVFSLLPLYSCR
jgi:hypothetical protein